MRPSPAELQLLRLLEEHGPSTVRQLHDAIGASTYTTTLKQLQMLHTKGLVTRDTSRRSHVYSTATSVKTAEKTLLRGFIDRVFGGSTRDLILGALGEGELSDTERAEIARLLEGADDPES